MSTLRRIWIKSALHGEGNLERSEPVGPPSPDRPSFPDAAARLLERARYADAAEVCVRGLAQHPHCVEGWLILGCAYEEDGQPGRARDSFRRALELSPENTLALSAAAELAERDGALDEARQFLQRAVLLEPESLELIERLRRLETAVRGRDAALHWEASSSDDDAPDYLVEARVRMLRRKQRLLEGLLQRASRPSTAGLSAPGGLEERYE